MNKQESKPVKLAPKVNILPTEFADEIKELDIEEQFEMCDALF